MEDKGKEN